MTAPPKKLIIAIDGPVGSGKSTLARRVAEMLGYVYVDTGAMYRALALKAVRQTIAPEAADVLVALAHDTRIDLRAEEGGQRVFLDGEDVTMEIRTPEVSQAASKIAVNPRWREHEQKGDAIDLKTTLEEIRERDRRDLERATSPLVRARDAVVVDSTAMEPEEAARLVVMLANGNATASKAT